MSLRVLLTADTDRCGRVVGAAIADRGIVVVRPSSVDPAESRAICAWKPAQIIIECSILFNEDDDVLNVPLPRGSGHRGTAEPERLTI